MTEWKARLFARRAPLVAIVATLGGARSAPAQEHAKAHPLATPLVIAARRESAIVIDGRLDEEAWTRAIPATVFTHTQPDEGRPATQRTEIRIVFDADAVYFGARMYDSLGARGVTARQVRRDDVNDGETDYLLIVFDTFHDHLGRMQFYVTPLGGKKDARGFGGETPDPSWDPVWEAATQIDSLGWTAEIRIPLSQLRMPSDSMQVWGLNFIRSIARLNERDFFAFWRRTEPGGASRFAHLEGLRFSRHRTPVELMPFALTQLNQPVAAAPGVGHRDWQRRLGGDYRIPVTPNFQVTGTVEPDFGQVELDPAVVNLTAFETFLPEKRPFFIQDGTLFGTGDFLCWYCESVAPPNIFFSRRIGRAPQAVGAASALYRVIDVPESTPILAATKLTGRTADGTSLGIIAAQTSAAEATIADSAGQHDLRVEPTAEYYVGRLKRDFVDGDVVVGGTLTSAFHHAPPSQFSSQFAHDATVASSDWNVAWREKTYSWSGVIVGSRVAGNTASVTRLEETSARYFQRPDRHATTGLFSTAFDTLATSLDGYSALTRLGKDGGNWVGDVVLSALSPGFEVNDLGFETRADAADVVANGGWNTTIRTRAYQEAHVVVGAQQRTNFNGDVLMRSVHAQGNVVLPDYLSLTLTRIEHEAALDDRLLRGGPVVGSPASASTELDLATDKKHRIVLQSGVQQTTLGFGGVSRSTYSTVTIRPQPSLLLSAGPSYTAVDRGAQYVTSAPDTTARAWFGTRYVLADLHQRTGALTGRVSVIPGTNLTIESFGQLLISAGRYDAFFTPALPRSAARSYYQPGVSMTIDSSTSPRQIRLGAPPSHTVSFPDPSFVTRALRADVVVRWEFKPGSLLTLVWQQTRNANVVRPVLNLPSDASAALSDVGKNIFAAKISYWLSS